jgi:hypothetical protein
MQKKVIGVIYVKLTEQSDVDAIQSLKKKWGMDASKVIRKLIRKEMGK